MYYNTLLGSEKKNTLIIWPLHGYGKNNISIPWPSLPLNNTELEAYISTLIWKLIEFIWSLVYVCYHHMKHKNLQMYLKRMDLSYYGIFSLRSKCCLLFTVYWCRNYFSCKILTLLEHFESVTFRIHFTGFWWHISMAD